MSWPPNTVFGSSRRHLSDSRRKPPNLLGARSKVPADFADCPEVGSELPLGAALGFDGGTARRLLRSRTMTTTPFGRLDRDVSELPRFEALTRNDPAGSVEPDSFERRLERERAQTVDRRDSGVEEAPSTEVRQRSDESPAPRSAVENDDTQGEPTAAPTDPVAQNTTPEQVEDSGDTLISRREPAADLRNQDSHGDQSLGQPRSPGTGGGPQANPTLSDTSAAIALNGPFATTATVATAAKPATSTITPAGVGSASPSSRSNGSSQNSAPLGSVTPRYFVASKGFDTDSILKRIAVETAKGGGRVEIELDPPDLGRIDIELVVEEGKTRVVLAVERGEVADAIERRLADLTRALEAQGLQVDEAQIHQRDAGDRSSGDRDKSSNEAADGQDGEAKERLGDRRIRHRVEGSGLDLLA